jgi:tetratricopeptide (TPR) repeat protein
MRAQSGPGEAVLSSIERRLSSWPGAEPIWQALLGMASKPGFPRLAGAAGILMQAGLAGEAEELYVAAARAFPGHPGAIAGLAQVAMRQKDWRAALGHWEAALRIAKDAGNPFWMSARAMVLVELGRVMEAESILTDLRAQFPDQPAGVFGLAQLAIRQQRWHRALELCDEILGRFGDHPAAADWLVMRASALSKLGHREEAETLARAVVEAYPILLSAVVLLARIQAGSGEAEKALETLNRGCFASIDTPELVEQRLELLICLDRRQDARRLHARLLEHGATPEMLESVFNFISRLFDPPERGPVLAALLHRSRAIQAQLEKRRAGSLEFLHARILLALRQWPEVLESIDRGEPYAGKHREMLLRVASRLRDPCFPDESKRKVFGIGLSRTGTTSLAAALTVLGLDTLHWSNPLTGEVISEDDLPLFDGFTDTPVSVRLEGLYERFPHARFVLTVRPFEDWARSMQELMRRTIGARDFEHLRSKLDAPGAVRYGSEFCAINRELYTSYATYREAYDVFHERVRRLFSDKPRECFLEMNFFAGDGWPKLCSFLGLDVPAAPFPWENRSPGGRVVSESGESDE